MSGAALRLIAFVAAVALATTRIGLVVHELVGHGGAANAVGAGVDEVRLFWFAGGWIHYSRDVEWTLRDALIVQLAGIAVELLVGTVAVLWARRRTDWLGAAVTGAGAGWMIHAGAYLAIGTWHGFGDGILLHQALGAAKAAVAIPIGLLCVAIAYLAARALTARFAATVPLPTRAGRLAVVAAAIAIAGGVLAGAARAELAVRADRTYGEIMKPERDREIEQELAAWLAAQKANGATLDRAAVDAERRALDASHGRTFPFNIVLVIAIAAAAIAGAARSRVPTERPSPPLTTGTVGKAWVAAAIALALVVGAGAIFPL